MVALHKVRAVALSGYEEVARSVGLDPEQMLERHGLSPLLLADPEQRLPATPVARLLEDSASESGEDGFALMLAERRTYDSFGPVTQLHRQLGSIREIVDATVQARRLVSDVFQLKVVDHDDGSFLSVGVLPQFAGTQSIILTVALTHLMLSGASRGNWDFHSVHFRQGAPTDTGKFETFFAAPVRFGQDADGFLCGRGSLDRRWQAESDVERAAGLLASLESRIAELKHQSGASDMLIRSLVEALDEIRSAIEAANH